MSYSRFEFTPIEFFARIFERKLTQTTKLYGQEIIRIVALHELFKLSNSFFRPYSPACQNMISEFSSRIKNSVFQYSHQNKSLNTCKKSSLVGLQCISFILLRTRQIGNTRFALKVVTYPHQG